jgi:hypothetical protein
MKSLRARLEALEEAARSASGSRQLDILVAAIEGDAGAVAQWERLRSCGALAGRFGELYDAITFPLQTDQSERED